MGKADVSLKDYLSDRERFADLFNAYLFEGAQVIKADKLEIINNESGVILPDNMGKRRKVTRFSGLRMRWKDTAELAILSTEFQEKG